MCNEISARPRGNLNCKLDILCTHEAKDEPEAGTRWLVQADRRATREEEFHCVDKTPLIHGLVDEGRSFCGGRSRSPGSRLTGYAMQVDAAKQTSVQARLKIGYTHADCVAIVDET